MGVPAETTADGRHRLKRNEFEAKPYVRWNAFVDIISEGPETFLKGRKRAAALVFLYESEIQNGGHDQYFSNTEGRFAEETVLALRKLGDECRAKVLAKALEAYRRSPESEDATSDTEFYCCEPELIRILEEHLDQNESLYIEWV